MTLPLLEIIPAGAGSGKTYTIQTRLSEWVQKGLVNPEKIVAVTFTEAAAAELRDRIRAELVKDGRIEDALRLDQAYMSTIHSFGLRIITEFAFEAGLSPVPRLLNDDEKDILIRLALARTNKADLVLGNLTQFGYEFDFNTQESPEDRFRSTILTMIEKLRSVGRLEGGDVLIPYALKGIEKLYGPVRKAAGLKKDLHSAVKAFLKKFPEDISKDYHIKKASDALRSDFRNLKRAEPGDGLEHDWGLWQKLRGLWMSQGRTQMPAEYDALAQTVRDAADMLPMHPGPLEEAKQHAEALLAASQDSLTRYGADKREKGLVDYADMVAIAQKVLTTRKDVRDELRSRIDCLVIDEFQDTNPLQFSLLWALQEANVPTLIVGDLKQAIMGFQNADYRLLAELQKQFRKAVNPLKANWRSSAPLMTWINRIGAGLFGREYTPLVPKAGFSSSLEPIEVIKYSSRSRNEIRAQYTAKRIKEILDDRSMKVYDKHVGKQRPVRGADIAVLCPTNNRLTYYADALNALGIRTRIEQDGWFGSRIIQIVYHALSYAADPADAHAALYLAVTELGNYDLEDALEAIVRGEKLDVPFLESLRNVNAAGFDKTADTLVAEVISAMDLHGIISQWPDASQARANLLRLQGEAREFMEANREALASGGYYGGGIKTFLAWLNKKQEIDDKQPVSRVRDEDAVDLATWHRSKGREWPVVAVCSTDYEADAKLPSFDVEYEDFSDLKKILEKAKISISPGFDAPETIDAFRVPLQREANVNSLRLLYVALTRAREKVILEWPGYLEGKEGNSYWGILKNATDMMLDDGILSVGKDTFDCRITEAGKNPPPGFEPATEALLEPLPIIGRRAVKPGKIPENLTPEAVTPSAMHGEEVQKVNGLVTESYGAGLELTGDLEPMQRGSILHRCFEIMGGLAIPIETAKRATGYDLSDAEYGNILKAIGELDAWIAAKFSPTAVQREVPILAMNSDGSVVSGVADLLVETADGLWIIDHKTDTSEDFDATFAYYYPQLTTYRDALAAAMPGRKVLGVGINWVKYGKATLLRQE